MSDGQWASSGQSKKSAANGRGMSLHFQPWTSQFKLWRPVGPPYGTSAFILFCLLAPFPLTLFSSVFASPSSSSTCSRPADIRGEEKLEHYELYIKKDRQALSAKARFGHRATGHPTIVHGGAIAALLDDSFGCLFLSQGASGFTASLNLQYKKPLPAARDFIVDASIDRVEQSKSGKSKVFMKGIVRDAENESIIYTEAEALFIATTAGLADGQTRISKKVAEIVAHVQPEAAASSGVAGAGAGAAAAAGATEGVAEAVEAQQ